jgi:hypothetical protein
MSKIIIRLDNAVMDVNLVFPAIPEPWATPAGAPRQTG